METGVVVLLFRIPSVIYPINYFLLQQLRGTGRWASRFESWRPFTWNGAVDVFQGVAVDMK